MNYTIIKLECSDYDDYDYEIIVIKGNYESSDLKAKLQELVHDNEKFPVKTSAHVQPRVVKFLKEQGFEVIDNFPSIVIDII